jgi:ABC-type multidrug transport system fused ATPase/permease subunit
MSTRLRKSLFGMPQRKDNFFLEDWISGVVCCVCALQGHWFAKILHSLIALPLVTIIILNNNNSNNDAWLGELISSVSSDVQEVRSAVKHTISMGIKSVTQVREAIWMQCNKTVTVCWNHNVQIAGGIVSLFLISPRLTTIMILLLPSLILVPYIDIYQHIGWREWHFVMFVHRLELCTQDFCRNCPREFSTLWQSPHQVREI